jgi:hypothetical protein
VARRRPKWTREGLALKRQLAKLANSSVKVGVLKGSDRRVQVGISAVELAAIHEFGSPRAGVPQRSFIRRTFNNNREEVAAKIAELAAQFVFSRTRMTMRGLMFWKKQRPRPSAARALGRLGAWGATLVKKTITTGVGVPPPLQPITIEKKKSTRPLVDTGRLLGAITWEVE